MPCLDTEGRMGILQPDSSALRSRRDTPLVMPHHQRRRAERAPKRRGSKKGGKYSSHRDHFNGSPRPTRLAIANRVTLCFGLSPTLHCRHLRAAHQQLVQPGLGASFGMAGCHRHTEPGDRPSSHWNLFKSLLPCLVDAVRPLLCFFIQLISLQRANHRRHSLAKIGQMISLNF